MENLSDVEIIALCQQNNEEAFEELYQRYYGFVYAKALRMCNNDADAKDVCQYVFCDVFRNLQSLRNPEMFKLWVMRITHSKCIYLFQHNRNEYYPIETLELMSNSQVKSQESQMLQQLHHQQDEEALQEIMQALKPKYQEILTMMYLQQLSLQEISDILQVPLGTIKTRAMTARRELRKKVELYERKEGCKLDFKIDALLPVSGFAYIKHWLQKHQTVLRFCTLSIATGAIVYAGATSVYPDMQKEIAQIEAPNALQKNERVELEDSNFPKVQIDYKTYYTSKSAYYGLLKWAEIDELKEKTKEDCLHIKPLYDALKSTNCVYYQQLKASGWSIQYEAKIEG